MTHIRHPESATKFSQIEQELRRNETFQLWDVLPLILGGNILYAIPSIPLKGTDGKSVVELMNVHLRYNTEDGTKISGTEYALSMTRFRASSTEQQNREIVGDNEFALIPFDAYNESASVISTPDGTVVAVTVKPDDCQIRIWVKTEIVKSLGLDETTTTDPSGN